MKRTFDCAIVKKRKELLLFAGILVIAGTALLIQLAGRETGGRISVWQEGELLMEQPLSEEGEWKIAAADGGYNVIQVRDGKAAVTEADCPDAVCVNSGWISYRGESVICLPHKLVVRIEGEAGEEGVDAVAG